MIQNISNRLLRIYENRFWKKRNRKLKLRGKGAIADGKLKKNVSFKKLKKRDIFNSKIKLSIVGRLDN